MACLCCSAALLYLSPARGELITLWRHGADLTNVHSLAIASICDSRGNIVVNGHRVAPGAGSAILVIKYSGTNGQILWTNEYIGPAQFDGVLDDFAPASGVDPEDNVLIAGNSRDLDQQRDATYLAKYDGETGNLLWEKRYYYASTNSSSPHKLVVNGFGDLFILGRSRHGIFVSKCSGLDGRILWEKPYPGPDDWSNAPRALQVAPDGHIVILLRTEARLAPCYLAKLNSTNGAVMWEQQSAGEPASLALDVQGNAFVGGKARDYPPASVNLWAAKFAAVDGTLLWEKLIDSPLMQEEDGGPISVDKLGNVVMTGLSVSDLFTVKLAGLDGTLLWQQLGPTVNGNYFLNQALDYQNNVLVAGNHHNGTNLDMVILKYATDGGNLLWEKRFSGNGEWDDVVFSLLVRPDNSIAVSGFTDKAPGPELRQDFLTMVFLEALNALRMELLSTGARLIFAGLPNRSYSIQRSSAFAGPWGPIATRTTDSQGALDFFDAGRQAGGAFYRVVAVE